MAKEKACKNCKRIYVEEVCPVCDRRETTDSFKGKVEIVDSEKSEIAKELKINKDGFYAVRL